MVIESNVLIRTRPELNVKQDDRNMSINLKKNNDTVHTLSNSN